MFMTIFKLVRGIHITNAKNVTSREKDPPPPGSHETNVLTKFHEDWTKNVTSRVFKCFHYIHIEKTAPPPGGHVFSPIWTIFELIRDINKTNVLTKFHDDWAKIVTSRVFTRNTAPPHCFELSRGIIRTNVLTKFHEDRIRNVASRVFTRRSQKLTMSTLCSGDVLKFHNAPNGSCDSSMCTFLMKEHQAGVISTEEQSNHNVVL
ncbi:hypothetical protein DPMN_127492 [Dreissena polymorpha]|uniref:Uncharacterized protein n=1 Tax=Dreissena polymorpha TaxID=45954 RepID=A0A9D4H223_DREPO|nr:hypothetical protein DPMN_127492 [Dreissena polymorpha]